MLIGLFAALALLPVATLMILSITAKAPPTLGVTNGRLANCPTTPNCVSTQCEVPSERCMTSTPWTESVEESMRRIKEVVASMPRTRIVMETDNYLHCEVRSLIFRFVDDMEFLVDADEKVIHFRSASRAGYSDMGVNRARMEEFQRRFEKLR